jgi:hypothetical protein
MPALFEQSRQRKTDKSTYGRRRQGAGLGSEAIKILPEMGRGGEKVVNV